MNAWVIPGLLVLALAWLLLGQPRETMAPREVSPTPTTTPQGGAPMQLPANTLDLGLPPTAVFFWGEVSRGKEPQANRRRALLADGTLLASRNSTEIDWDAIERAPFNTPWGPFPASKVPADELAAFLAEVDGLGLFALKGPVEPPAGWKVHGGMSSFVFVKLGERSTLVEFRPGAERLSQLKAVWDALLTRHHRP